jgi:hypothetical protein
VIIDNLTLSGLIVTSLYALMPIMMGREFIRVRTCRDAQNPANVHGTVPPRQMKRLLHRESSDARQDDDGPTVTAFTAPERRTATAIEDCIGGS